MQATAFLLKTVTVITKVLECGTQRAGKIDIINDGKGISLAGHRSKREFVSPIEALSCVSYQFRSISCKLEPLGAS
jgi:hypothetical protein